MSIGEEKKKALKLSGLMVSASVLGKILGIPIKIVTAGVLGPALLGMVAMVNLVVQWSSFTQLGFLAGLSRSVPLAYGRGDTSEVKEIKNTVFSCFFFLSILSIVLLWLIYFSGILFFKTFDARLVVLISLIIAASKANSFLHTYIKAEGKFMILGRLDFVSQVFAPLMAMFLIVSLKFHGAVLGILFTQLILAVMSYVWLGKPSFQFQVNRQKLKEISSSGTYLYINSIMEGLFMGIGLMLAASMLPAGEVGIYSFAIAIVSGSNVPFSDGFLLIISRKMLLEAGQFGAESKKWAQKYLQRYYAVFLLLMSFVLGNMVIIYMFIVDVYLVKFQSSVAPMLVLYSGYLIYTSRVLLYRYLSATDQLLKRTKVLFMGLCVNFGLSYIFILQGFGILGISFACSISFVLISVTLIFDVYRQVFNSLMYPLLFCLKLFLVSGTLTGVLFIFFNFNFFTSGADAGVVEKTVWGLSDVIVKGISFSIVCVSIHLVLFKKYGIKEEIRVLLTYVAQWLSTKRRHLLPGS